MTLTFRSLLLAFIIFSASSVRAAKVYELFDGPNPRWDYHETIKKLKANGKGKVRFSNGKVVELTAFIGEGQSTFIFETSTGHAIRLASPYYNKNWKNLGFLKLYAETHKELLDLALPIPMISEVGKAGNTVQYILLEKISVQFDLETALQRSLLPAASSQQPIIENLKKFALQTALFEDIGDFNFTQIVWDGSRWVLLDWTSGVLLASRMSEHMLWDKWLNRAPPIDGQEILAALRQIVRDFRRLSDEAPRCDFLK